MSSPRSFIAVKQPQDNHIPAESRRPNGRFWSRRSMNEHSPDGSAFSFRSMFLPLAPSTNMQQSDDQTKHPPQPASSMQNRLAPAHDYADKVFRRFHHHTISDLSSPGSNDSSPTTTISTVDDSSATEPSPGSSPESPPPSTFAVGMIRPRTSDDARPFFELQKQAPPKKGRNLKNLAVNTARKPGGPSVSTPSLPLNGAKLNGPEKISVASPSFVKPPTPPKKRPSNLGLTLLTPGTGKVPPQEIKLAIPPTPSIGRPGTLRHFQSSPSLPLFTGLGSPTHFALPPARAHPTLETILSPIQPKQLDEEEEQNFDVPLSKEEKPEAYPDGPICVYDPHIDLYLEPTAEQCKKYDVIMNVASEVRNPFVEYAEPDPTKQGIRIDGGGGIQFAPKRDLTTVIQNATAFDSSPTTPKATPLTSTFPPNVAASPSDQPEYIHIKWEHNSDIVPDLLGLVKLIDEKVVQRKRVLIHCQCGVSRSASLVVAYGLFKDPTLSVQEAYDAVKQRSKWIGPNMNLIMQLQEFRTSLMRGGMLSGTRGLTPITPSSAFREWSNASGPFGGGNNYVATPSAAPLSAGVAHPLAKHQASDSLPSLSPGPSSAPSGVEWPTKQQISGQRARAISAVPGSAYVDTSGHVLAGSKVPVVRIMDSDEAAADPRLPLRQRAHSNRNRDESGSVTPTAPLKTSSPAQDEFAMAPLQPSPEVDAADDFGIMSPTTTEFSSSPFDRSALLAQLGMGSIGQQEDLGPRRSISLRSKPKAKEPQEPNVPSLGKGLTRLRGKVSTPNLREQQQLQGIQASIRGSQTQDDDALLSPRATEFTQNPFALSLAIPEDHSTENANAPKTTDSDPRSPVAQKGVSPITRSIFDVL